jgi:hypothetical protein
MNKKSIFPKLAEGIEDSSFQRFYSFFIGWGSLLTLYTTYFFMLLLPRRFVDFPGPRNILTWLPKFWFESKNFKQKFPLEDVHFYFSTMLLIYTIILTISIVSATRCYRTGLKFPFTFTQSQPWKPYRNFVIPALTAVLLGTMMPMPVGGENKGFRGNPFENPLYLPAYCIVFFGFLLVVFPAGALWLGRERARLKLERKEPRKPFFSISLSEGERADN